MRMEPAFIKAQIQTLLASFPELADDEILRRDSIEAETDAMELLKKLVRDCGETEGAIEGLKSYIGELETRKDRFARRKEAIRQLAFQIMDAASLPSLRLPEATLTIRQGTAKVVITDEKKIPEQFFRIKREVAKDELKTALKSGQLIEGAELSNGQPTLAIRKN